MSGNPFKPAWWLRNSHLQTIWPVLCKRKIKNMTLERERLDLPDGDFIDLDWMGKDRPGPLVLMLHGFEGSIDSHYAKATLSILKQSGWRGVFMHFRGCSGEPNRLPRGYHSGETSDVATVVRMLRSREPGTKLAAIGYSLGGNVLLKWLGEMGADSPLSAAIAVSVPFELHKAAARIQCGFSRFYQWYFLKCLRRRLYHKFEQVPCAIDRSIMSAAQTLRDFDHIYTAPVHGFDSVDDYYASASSRQYLSRIQVPTLLLHARDDPFMTEDVIPAYDELSPMVKLEVTEGGGHVGFVMGQYPWRPEYWLEKRIPLFLAKFLT
ncbi:MAG: alpha/beta hydrolase [Gammaproteobacteria bacterium RIFCSPHIGHO2_12_FULL_45_12]|nr:MAG: alpha/beta hydrolase [Gammaproteobacteria bacterium RIFCSPHIGHO2_12_FULL_45_12]